MFMNLSCIRTSHFFLLIFVIDWYCSVCVSLSFSLFLSDSLRMAPKRKSAPSRDPLHSEASSSSDSTPLYVRFCDDKARKDFSKNFSRRGIHLELQVVLSDFFDTDLPTVIHSRDWESLFDILVSCPSVIIHEFYSNMHGFESSIPRFLTFIRGICIIFTAEFIFDVLHVSHPDYPGCPCLRTVSKDELMSLFCETPSS